MLTLGGFCIVQISTVFEEANYARINSIPSVEQIDLINQGFFRMRLATWQYISSADDVERKQLGETIQAAEKQIASAVLKYEAEDISDHQDAILLTRVRQSTSAYYPKRDYILALSRAGNADQARRQLIAMMPFISEVEHTIAAQRSYNQNLAVIGSQNAAASRRYAIWMAICITLLFTVGIYAGGKILVYETHNRPDPAVVEPLFSDDSGTRAR